MLWFLLIWAATQFILLYLPFPFQRRLIAGIQFPLALLGAYALDRLKSRAVIALVILAFSMGNVVIMTQFISELVPRTMPFYMSRSYHEAFEWLRQQPDKDAAVLSGFVTGNLIPGFTGLSSYMGHSSLTPQIAKKRQAAGEFYQNPSLEFPAQNKIRYIFWGLEERHISKAPLHEIFETVFQNKEVRILIPRLKNHQPGLAFIPANSARIVVSRKVR